MIFKNIWILFAFDIILIFAEIIFYKTLITSKKTPLKFTNKIKRLYLISVIILALPISFKLCVPSSSMLLIFVPTVANLINIYDKIRNINFIKAAKKKITNQKTKIIAITGSNGKTSVKNILQSMLETTFKTQATPKSFNTPLGISRFINEKLKPDCEYLILEYGARRIGDINKLCKNFGADYGIIITVAPQHLQTFGSIQNVFKAKKELSDFLKNKTCIYNLDNIYTLMMHQEKVNNRIGVSMFCNSPFTASKIKIKNYKTYFEIINNQTHQSVNTKLLGKHNVLNIMLAYALATNLGVEESKLLSVISNLNPVPHRLEYVKGAINILDDSYNCSISSASEAIDVLLHCKNKKMVVTPGIIEGGKKEYKLNVQLGLMCAKVDYVVIVGEHNKKALLEGLNSEKTKVNMFFAKTLDDAKQYFTQLSKNDTLLLLNDLPDDYT